MQDIKKIALDLKEMQEAIEITEDIAAFLDDRRCEIEDLDIERRLLELEGFHDTHRAIQQRNIREVFDSLENLSDRVLRLEEVLNKMVN